MRLVIARAGRDHGNRIIAIEQGGYREDWPPSPRSITDRWKAQGVIKDDRQVEVWEEARMGYYYTPMTRIPTDDETYSSADKST